MFAVSGQGELPYVAAKLNGKEVSFLFDTGSSLSVVSEHLVDKLGLHNNMLPSKVKTAISANGNNIAFKHAVKCNFVVKDNCADAIFHVGDIVPEVLGMDLLRQLPFLLS